MEKEPITVSGLQNLKAELEDLKNIQRPKIVEAIAEARSHGDLKENAESVSYTHLTLPTTPYV